jgi:phosphatidylserine synthase
MKKSTAYFLGLSLLASALFVAYFLLQSLLPLETPLAIAAFYGITFISHLLLIRAMTHRPAAFQMNFMMAMGFKMLAYLIFIALIHFLVAPIQLPFVLVFFLCYLCFTAYEMVALQSFRKSGKP